MIALVLLGAAALVQVGGAPDWLVALVALPALLWAPGLSWARWLAGDRPMPRLRQLVDAAWLSMAFVWFAVGLARELGLRDGSAMWAIWLMVGAASAAGWFLARGRPAPSPLPPRALLGLAAIGLALVCLSQWRGADLVRPLDGSWYLDGAAEEQAPLPVRPGAGWSSPERMGWEEANAWQGGIQGQALEITATAPARGKLVLAVRGPVGSRIQSGAQSATVAAHMTEHADEGPVLRYLERGVASIALDVDLQPGETVRVQARGDQAYLFAGSEAVWAAHGSGELRFVHYYQLLNQAENLVWARELLDTRRFTWNQPPGWTPLLAMTTLWVGLDMPAAGFLFLFVLAVVGAGGLRLALLLAPSAPKLAFFVPGGLVAAHGLMMLEPGSHNFPDSLFAAAVVAVAGALVDGRWRWFAFLGFCAGMLRWPGIVLASLLATWWWATHQRPVWASVWRGLAALWAMTAVAALFVGALVLAGQAEDLLFILYFETFPEHWHDDYAATSLLPRIPRFYVLWAAYSGGGLVLAALAALGRPTPARRRLWFLLGGALTYSAILCTIDHHPTHYFLPLVAMTGPLVVTAATIPRWRPLRWAPPLLTLIGLAWFLWEARVY